MNFLTFAFAVVGVPTVASIVVNELPETRLGEATVHEGVILKHKQANIKRSITVSLDIFTM